MAVGERRGQRARDGAGAAVSPFRRRWSWRTGVAVTLIGWCAGLALALLYRTLRVHVADPTDRVGAWARGERVVVVFWHEALLLLPLVARRVASAARPTVMLSWHRDAEIAAQAIRRFGVGVVRGSSTRGWAGGVRGLLEAHARGDDLVVVPDGPRGPRHVAKAGAVQLARTTGLPVVAVGAAAAPASRLGSWDRLQVPWPLGRVGVVFSAPVPVAGGTLEEARARVEAVLRETQAQAGSIIGGRR